MLHSVEPDEAHQRLWSVVSAELEVSQVEDQRPRDGFEVFYADNYLKVVRTAALITGSEPVAEEIAQDALLQLLRRWDSIEHPSAWVRRATISGCRTWQRRHIRERERSPARELATSDPDGLAVRQALSVLSTRQRAAVVLRYFDDLSEVDIATALGCRPGTVKSLLARSLPKLKEALRD